MKPLISKEEKIAIAKRARALVKKGWTKGAWQDGQTPSGNTRRCLEGHCNAAAIEILGAEKAINLGAARRSFTGDVKIAHSGEFTKRLSVARKAKAKFESLYGRATSLVCAGQMFNDAAATKKADVVDLLDEYIMDLEGK